MKMHIKEFADLTGVSVRTIHYYDEIGLLKPGYVDGNNGYRYYDESSLLRMQEILFYRELDFPLKTICRIISSPGYDRKLALAEQRKLLILKKQRLERIIESVDNAMKGEIILSTFDNKEYEQYREEVRERWGSTGAYGEYTEKTRDRTPEKQNDIINGLEQVFSDFVCCMNDGEPADSEKAQKNVKRLRDYISENFYTCTDTILSGLGKMYVSDERFKNNIDRHSPGTAEYVSRAIGIYCSTK